MKNRKIIFRFFLVFTIVIGSTSTQIAFAKQQVLANKPYV